MHITKNVLWIVDDFLQTLPPNKSKEYIEGWQYGVVQTRDRLKRQLNYGLESNDIFDSDWSEVTDNEK